jgi:hypothetical protein
MANPQGNNAYYSIYPTGFVNGLGVARASTTTLTLALGKCRDSTDTSNISLASAATINSAVVGANGIDVGSLAASTMYAVFVVGDSLGKNSSVGLISTSFTAPALPSGYDMFRLVGYWATNGSTQFILGYTYGTGSQRTFLYDAAVATSVTAGAATSYTAIDLSTIVPSIEGIPALIYAGLTPATAGNAAKFRPSGGTGDSHTLTGVVATKISDGQFKILTKLASSLAKIDYKVANASDALAVSVEGFEFSL